MKRHRRNAALTRRAIAIGVVVASVILQPVVSSAQDSDTEKERDEVREQQTRVDLQIDALEAEDVEVRAALETLSANVETQRGQLEEAERAAAEAAAEVVQADQAVSVAEQRITELNDATDELVIEAFVNPPRDSAFEALKSESMSDATVKKALIDISAHTDADLLDQLEGAHVDLEYEKSVKEELARVAEQKRDDAASQLAGLEDALGQQQDFAAQLEERLNSKLAEAESLKLIDEQLSEQIEREQAELARKLQALHEAEQRRQDEARRAAEQAAAEQAAAEQAKSSQSPAAPSSTAPTPAAPTPAPSPAPPPPPAPPRSTVQPAPGGLATVSCPHGGSITVAGSIAGNVQSLLNDAAAAGLALCGGGHRDPQRQIELRQSHCGTSEYAIWQMPSSQCSPPTARPGSSQHEVGLAIDFTCSGGSMGGSPCFHWLVSNASRYGLYNLPSEPWHWSTTGR